MPCMWHQECCPVTIETAHSCHRSTSPNNANEERHSQISEQGSAPMPPYMAWVLGNGKLPHDLINVETAHPWHCSTSLNDANEEPHTQVNEQGSVPMPHMWHGHWGIGHTPNCECAHIPIAVFSLTPCLQTRNHGAPRTANERCICGIGAGESEILQISECSTMPCRRPPLR